MDKMREEFEAWFSKEISMPMAYLNKTIVDLMYSSWKASRKSLVVSLSRDVMNVTNKNYEEARDDVIAAVEAAGITIKGEE